MDEGERRSRAEKIVNLVEGMTYREWSNIARAIENEYRVLANKAQLVVRPALVKNAKEDA